MFIGYFFPKKTYIALVIELINGNKYHYNLPNASICVTQIQYYQCIYQVMKPIYMPSQKTDGIAL